MSHNCHIQVLLPGHHTVLMILSVITERSKGNDADTIIGGFVRGRSDTHNAGHGVTVEQVRPDEMTASGNLTLQERKKARLERKKRCTKLSIMGISKAVLDVGDPKYVRCLDMANKYRKVRARELAELHGYVSSGASALLASGSLALAASRFLYERFAEDGGGAYGIGMLKQAAQLADSARQSELAAWEMSAREGLSKRRLDAATAGVPWLAIQDGGKTKDGRKTNVERKVLDAPALAPYIDSGTMAAAGWSVGQPVVVHSTNG